MVNHIFNKSLIQILNKEYNTILVFIMFFFCGLFFGLKKRVDLNMITNFQCYDL